MPGLPDADVFHVVKGMPRSSVSAARFGSVIATLRFVGGSLQGVHRVAVRVGLSGECVSGALNAPPPPRHNKGPDHWSGPSSEMMRSAVARNSAVTSSAVR